MATPEEQISAIVTAGLEAAGQDVVSVIQYEINEAYPPASEPGTPPHLRTGVLQAGIRSQVDQFHDGITLSIISDAFYSQFLRDGTSRRLAPRDFFGDAAVQRYLPLIIQSLQEYLGSGNELQGAFQFVDSRLNSLVAS